MTQKTNFLGEDVELLSVIFFIFKQNNDTIMTSGLYNFNILVTNKTACCLNKLWEQTHTLVIYRRVQTMLFATGIKKVS